MSANRIFLVCSHCPSFDQALMLAERGEASARYEVGRLKHADEWFAKHIRCGGPDDFQLAFHRPPNWDVSPDATETAAGQVRLAIADQ